MKCQVKWEYAEMNEKEQNVTTYGVFRNQCLEEIYTAEFLY